MSHSSRDAIGDSASSRLSRPAELVGFVLARRVVSPNRDDWELSYSLRSMKEEVGEVEESDEVRVTSGESPNGTRGGGEDSCRAGQPRNCGVHEACDDCSEQSVPPHRL